jgi:RNA polymerase sigma-70 factor (ECF subfamily)
VERRAHTGSTPTSIDPSGRALAQVFEDNIDVVFGYVLARCGSRHTAEEVAAETFSEAARVHVAGRGCELDRGWLLHVARLRLIDHWRKTERQRRRVARLATMSVRDEVVPDADDGDPAVQAALDSLSSRQRAVLLLRYVDEYSVSEVADAMELSYQATESLLARARRALLSAYQAMEGALG